MDLLLYLVHICAHPGDGVKARKSVCVGVGGMRPRRQDSYWSMWKVDTEGTLRAVTGEIEEIHSIRKEALPGLGSDAASPRCCGSLLHASAHHPSSPFLLLTVRLYDHSSDSGKTDEPQFSLEGSS